MGKLFGTDGVRGISGTEFTPEMALRLGRAIGAFYGPGSRVLVGRDVRAGGDMIANAVISGLLSEGVKVYYVGMIPTPALQLAVKRGPYEGGVMVTASHNPPEYNGIKVMGPEGVELSREEERVVEEYYFSNHASKLEWRSLTYSVEVRHGIIEEYVDTIVGHVDRDSIAKLGARVVVDCANSVSSLSTPTLLRKLGVKTLSINCHLDPEFPGREPEPTPDTLKEAAALVASAGALLGVGHDGDADRAIFVDDRGVVHWGDRSAALLSYHASQRWDAPKRVFTGVSSSTLVEEYLRPKGIEVVWTAVGSVLLARTLWKEGGIAAFEENGGFILSPHQHVRDGAMKLALMLDLIAAEGVKPSELFSRLPRYISKKTKVKATREEAACAVEGVKELFAGYRQITIDGVKVFGEDFWMLVRPSGTEPVVRIMAEALSEERLNEVVNKAMEIVQRCKGGRQ
ncbi:MAG: phosphoglucosamine mutase [Acidilobaceae archaeon]|nr:phosphoglucosamine mutase [Acidilobaceae archaeon]MDW7974107.1 phosphoglucosamine mutase [Sulfolobales archaeon]